MPVGVLEGGWGEERAEIVVGEPVHDWGVVVEGGFHEPAFFLLEEEDFFFDGA
jgi:hypothetical protein